MASGGSPKQDEHTKRAIQTCLIYLKHSSQCYDTKCHQVSCQRMKKVMNHARLCTRSETENKGCPICKQLADLCWEHARNCQDRQCVVIFCNNIKLKLRQKEHQRKSRRNAIETIVETSLRIVKDTTVVRVETRWHEPHKQCKKQG